MTPAVTSAVTSILALTRALLTVACLAAAGMSLAATLDDLLGAADLGDQRTVAELVQRGMDVNSTDAHGNSLLMIAARNGYVELTDYLIRHRARVDARNRAGDTALMLASFKGHAPVVARLLQAGAKANQPGWSPLAYAAMEGHTEAVRALLQRGANPNAPAVNRTTPLMLAARGAHIEVVKLLVAAGADIDAADDEGNSAMVWAARRGNTDIVEYLQAVPIK